MNRQMQPGGYEFRRKTPTARMRLSAKEMGLLLEALSEFKQAKPQRWLKIHDQIIVKLMDGLKRLPSRVPEQSSHIRNLPLFSQVDFRDLGDVAKIGED